MKALRHKGTYTFGGTAYPTVTTILSVIAKPALVYWAGKMVAEEAVRLVREGATLNERALAAVPGKAKDAKADVGQMVHWALEVWAGGERVEPEQVPEEARPWVAALGEYLPRCRPVMVEATVFKREPRYAGTLDAVVEVGGENVLVDVKTGKRVYPEAALQVAAYRHADFVGRADGSVESLPRIDRAMVLHVTPDGVEEVHVNADEVDYDAFLAALRLWRYLNEAK